VIFKKLSEDSSARFLGLRGLLRQAMQREDWPEAQRLAREAEAAQPGAAWLREERRLLAERTQDWREALALTPPDGPRAALALAAAAVEPDPAKSAELEKQAVAADAKFAPAALAQAARLMAAGSQRRARNVLEAAWNAAPHPDLGAAWIEAVPAPLARVKAVEDLTHRNPGHPEARLLMARVALAAGLTGRARSELDGLLASGAADRRAYLLFAELERAEHGDSAEGRAAEAAWLREAANAAGAPRWRCDACGAEHSAWKPDCAACGAMGRIGWSRN
jgi:HemY protein